MMSVMTSINIMELRQHLPEYLKQVKAEKFLHSLHGKAIARIVPDLRESKRDAALKRLDALRGTVIAGDILASLNEEWASDADNP